MFGSSFSATSVIFNSTTDDGSHYDINIAGNTTGYMLNCQVIGDDINIVASDSLEIDNTPITSYRPYYSLQESQAKEERGSVVSLMRRL